MDYGSPIQPELDWEAYLEKFMQKHGKAVPYGYKWLFSDGWQYSMTDPAGPEYPPPGDIHQHRKLRSEWKRIRVWMLELEVQEMNRLIFDLEELQSTHDLPLQVGTLITRDGEEEYIEVNASLNLEGLKQRLVQIRSELKQVQEVDITEEVSSHGNNGKRTPA